MLSIDSKFYKQVAKNRKKTLKAICKINQAKSGAEKEFLAGVALDLACKNNSGIYFSPEIEDVYLEIAQRFKVRPAVFQPNSFLHVMTEAYPSGGHTRVVERWICSAGPDEIHSLVVLEQSPSVTFPQALSNSVRARNGQLFLYDHSLGQIERAKRLRELATRYEYIILHIHMDDPIATIAFGGSEFDRPVILFNHADHAYWCGLAIADIVAELSSSGRERTLKKRGYVKSEILGIPAAPNFMNMLFEKHDSRKKLNLPEDKKIILTSGSPAKFNSLPGENLTDVLLSILIDLPDTLCCVIGPKKWEKPWSDAYESMPGRFIFLPQCDYDKEYLLYLAASDVVFDSYPLPGGTTMVDAVAAGKPVLSLATPLKQMDYLLSSPCYCETKDDFIKKAKCILSNQLYSDKLAQNVNLSFIATNSTPSWLKSKDHLLSVTPKMHSVKKYSPPAHQPVDAGEILIAILGDRNFAKFSFKICFKAFKRFFFERVKTRNYSCICIFGKPFFRSTRLL